MNNERFILVLCALAGVAIIAFLSGVVFAHHKGEYRGMDDRLQNDFTSDPENHISANWALTPTVGSTVTWFTDDPKTPNPTITPIAPLVRKSIAEWTTALPQLQYDEVDDDASDDTLKTTRASSSNPVAELASVRLTRLNALQLAEAASRFPRGIMTM